jgi:hypothetical protein
MSSKRPAIDLMALTAEQATPMAEAVQRTATQPIVAAPAATLTVVPKASPVPRKREGASVPEPTATANLEGLSFKIPPAFRTRFRTRAAEANLKLNELLFEAFDAWEAHKGFKK